LQPVLSKCPKCITWKGNTNSVFLGKETEAKRDNLKEKREERGTRRKGKGNSK
jgi:hypothetical protein